MRIGHGYDVHRLVPGRKLILGGVEVPFEKGLDGHSDADVLVHAVMDAMLGAAALGDIGKLFPDNDDAYLGADSMELLKKVRDALRAHGWRLGNLDATVIAQRPKLAPFIDTMRSNIAGDDGGAARLYGKRRGNRGARRVPDSARMSEARKYPSWYWTKGLHDAKILEASMRDDALVLHIDSGNAMYDNFVEQIVFLDARLKTPLPAPTKRKPVYWIWDELTELPFEQWKLHIQLETGFSRGKAVEQPLIVVFQSAITTRTNV